MVAIGAVSVWSVPDASQRIVWAIGAMMKMHTKPLVTAAQVRESAE